MAGDLTVKLVVDTEAVQQAIEQIKAAAEGSKADIHVHITAGFVSDEQIARVVSGSIDRVGRLRNA